MEKLKKILLIFLFLFNGRAFPAISKTADTVFDFNKSVFVSLYNFYLGAAVGATNTDISALVKARVESDTEIKIDSFADKKALVNFKNTEGLSGNDLKAKKVTNPINNNQIVYLAAQVELPVVVLKNDTAGLGDTQKIAKAITKDTVSTTVVNLQDANTANTEGISGIAASSDKIFAAVRGNGQNFGEDNNSGFAVVISDSDTNQLKPVNAATGAESGNVPVRLDLTALGALLAVTQDANIADSATVADGVDMYYDATLKRLFVALRVQRSNNNALGSVVALLVGRVDSSDSDNPHKLVLEAVVDVSSLPFVVGGTNHVIGFTREADTTDWIASLHKIRTLHTSTQKSYVIVNGKVDTGAVKNRIYALPIVRTSSTTGEIGKIAKKSDHSTIVASAAEMTLDSDAAAMVGGGILPVHSTEDNSNQDVQEIFTVGDTVFVCVESATPIRSGIYKSTALFDSDGKIARWTEWQRVMGSIDKVFGGGLDTGTGQFMYLTEGTSKNVVKAALWGKGASDGLLGDLVTLMSSSFPFGNAGVQGLFDFSETTTPFHPAGEDDNLSMMVATGYKKVALIETGNQTAGSFFVPRTGDFSGSTLVGTGGSAPNGAAGTAAIVISGGVLDMLGPICTCDISRVGLSGTDEKGWLFIGGQNGVAVLSDDTTGNGWDTGKDIGLKRGFVGITNNMSFKRLGSITGVRKLVCDGTNLYVLTNTSLVKIPLDSANFSTAGSATLPGAVTLATASSVTGDNSGVFYDFLVSSKVGFIATSAGVFRVGNSKNISTDAVLDWTEITVSGYSLGPVVYMDLVTEKRGGSKEGGNLYVLAADLSFNLATVYRFDVVDTSVAIGNSSVLPIQEVDDLIYFFTFGRFRSLFRTDGALVFHQNPKHFEDAELLKMSIMQPKISTFGRGAAIDLKDIGETTNIALIIRNSASGAWMVPGDFGIRVDE